MTEDGALRSDSSLITVISGTESEASGKSGCPFAGVMQPTIEILLAISASVRPGAESGFFRNAAVVLERMSLMSFSAFSRPLTEINRPPLV